MRRLRLPVEGQPIEQPYIPDAVEGGVHTSSGKQRVEWAMLPYDIQQVKGITNILFAGEGLFLATLRGPGKVWLQTMPVSVLAAAIRQFIPTKSS